MVRKSPCPQLAPQVQATIEALRADGIEPTPAEVVWLARLREPCDKVRADGDLPPLFNAPVVLAGVRFWPLHPLAGMWFRRAWALVGDEGSWRTWAYMFAHIYSAPGDWTLQTMTEREAILTAVGEWRGNAPIHEEHDADIVAFLRLFDGYEDSVPDPAEKPKPHQAASSAPGVSGLCKRFPGTTPDYWIAGISEKEIDELMRQGDAGDFATSAARDAAIKRYLTAVKWVRLAHTGGATNGE